MTTDAILIVTGGHLQVPAVEAARKLGLRSIVTDRDIHCACAEIADEFYPIDIFDAPAHVDLARGLAKNGVRLRGVLGAATNAIVTVAETAAAMRLHHAPLKVVRACDSKYQTRKALQAGRVPQPHFEMVTTLESAQEAVRLLGPAIVKATGGMGGRGHTKVNTPEDVTPEVCAKALQYSRGGYILVEELLDGLELSAEAVWYNGAMTPLNIVERPFLHRYLDDLERYVNDAFVGHVRGMTVAEKRPGEPLELIAWGLPVELGERFAFELGHYNPAILPRPVWEECWDVMERAGVAIGLVAAPKGHIFKGDLIWTDGGVKVLELAVRLSGNFDSGRTSPRAHGVDYTAGAMKLACGASPDWSLFAPRWYRHSACLFKFAPAGRIASVELPETDAEIIQRYGVGATVPPAESYAALSAWVIGDGATRAEAVGQAFEGLRGVRYRMEGEKL